MSRISGGPTTTSDLATHLGVSKHGAAQLVEYLVQRGYLRRESNPADGRARSLVLTDHGRACTVAADEAAGNVVEQWRHQLPQQQFDHLQDALLRLAVPGRLRPAW